jgi:hypothetical protein
MRAALPFALASSLVLLVGCSSAGNPSTDTGVTDDVGADAVADASADATTDTASADSGGADAAPDAAPDAATPTWSAGVPGKCTSRAIPAEGKPADVSKPTTVVGNGTAASCTFAALDAAVTAGGVITFDCGASPVTIAVTATMHLPTTKNTVIDGGRKVTLDGGGKVQILRFESANFQALETRVTLQHLRFVNGAIAGSSPIPTAPAPCSQGFNDGEGGAIFMRDGNLSVIDSIFQNDKAAPLGPDVAGGAIRMLGSKHGVVIVASSFLGNSASNGAAVGCLFSELDVYDSRFEGNVASGHDANNDDASKCNVINNGQHEIGSGGNGGALYSDGNSVNVLLCGDEIVNNAAGTNAFGGGLFFTSNNFGGTLTIADTTMTGNTGGHWTQVSTGSTNNAGTAVGTNCKSLTITNSTIQGVP